MPFNAFCFLSTILHLRSIAALVFKKLKSSKWKINWSNRAELYFPDEIDQHTVLRRTRSSTPTRLSFCQWLFDILFGFPGAAAIKHNLSSCLWLNFSLYAKQKWLFDILSNFRFPSTHLQLDLPQFQCWFAWKIVLALNSISLVVTC